MFCANLGAVVGAAATTYWLNSFTTSSPTQIGSMGVDSSGNVYMMQGDSGLCFVAKYNSAGTIQWQKYIDNGGTPVDFTGMAVSAAGNVYLNTSGNIVKLTTAGAISWQKLSTGAGVYINSGSPITLDASENVYIAYQDAFTQPCVMKLTSAGAITWQRAISASSLPASPQGVAVDSSGNVYVQFDLDGGLSGGVIDAYIAKFNSTGTIQWQRTAAGSGESGSGQGAGQMLTCDTAGNVFSLSGAVGGSTYVTKLNTSGTVQWSKTVNSTYNSSGGSIALDASGNVYAVYGAVISAVVVPVIIKLDSTGAMLYSRNITGTGAILGTSIAIPSTTAMAVLAIPVGIGVTVQLPLDGTKAGTYGGYTYAATAYTSTTRTSGLIAVTLTVSTTTYTLSNSAYTSITSTKTNTRTLIP